MKKDGKGKKPDTKSKAPKHPGKATNENHSDIMHDAIYNEADAIRVAEAEENAKATSEGSNTNADANSGADEAQSKSKLKSNDATEASSEIKPAPRKARANKTPLPTNNPYMGNEVLPTISANKTVEFDGNVFQLKEIADALAKQANNIPLTEYEISRLYKMDALSNYRKGQLATALAPNTCRTAQSAAKLKVLAKAHEERATRIMQMDIETINFILDFHTHRQALRRVGIR